MKLGAAILLGGRSLRMGRDKAFLDWNGRTAVDRVFATAAEAGAEVALGVGRDVPGRTSVIDDKAGPAGGVMLAVRQLREAGCGRALILAVDAPTLTADDLAPLLEAPQGAAYEQQHLPMVLPLAAMPTEAEPGWPLGRLIERAGLARLVCPAERLARVRGANTPEEHAALLADLVRREGACGGGAG